MVSEFRAGDEDAEAFDAGYAFSVGAHLGYVYLVRVAKFNGDFASAAFVLGVSWSSFSWTNRTFSLLSLFTQLIVYYYTCSIA